VLVRTKMGRRRRRRRRRHLFDSSTWQ